MSLNARSIASRFSFLALLIVLALTSATVLAQTTLSTGSISGTVTDPSGAVVSGAKVVITNTATAQTIDLTSNAAGAFNSGALSPGDYKVQVSYKGFSTISQVVGVQVGNTSTVNAKLAVGKESEIVEVQATQVAVNTEQAIVQGVISSEQVDNLPVNGRNFLDLAQLEPGVQIQDGQNFDPTKAGYSSISFGGRFGRTARINVDGVDISDETVGTTTADVPASAIDEFQISQSTLDLSQDVTSSGAINVTTKSGTNNFHGEAFGFFRDHSMSAESPLGDLPFQRDQFGGRFGGPVIKNKLFFFMDGERTKQDALAPVAIGAPFQDFSGGFSQPFRSNSLIGRVDYNLKNGSRLFYKYNYFSNSLQATFGLGFSVYNNKDYTRNHVVGFDFNTGTFQHSIRFSYLKFQNAILDATTGNNSLPLSNLGVELSTGTFFVGPNLLAPQTTPQANREIKYDGSKVFHSHTFRYGFSFNHIQGGGFASFYGSAPRVSWTNNAANQNFASDSCDPSQTYDPSNGLTPCFAGGASNPLNYPTQRVRWGNGQGFNTENPALGFPAGGLGPDNRLGLYIGDTWKVKPNFTLSLGLRYDRDTGRTDSDLPAIPEINAEFPGWGNPVKQANMNLAPQIGIAWDPGKNGKTVIRAGAGLFFENVIYNNVLFDRPFRLRDGAFNIVTSGCNNAYTPAPVPVSTSFDPSGFITPGVGIEAANVICIDPNHLIPVGNVIPQILSFWNDVLAGNPFSLNNPNPNFIGGFLGTGQGVPLGPFGPDYKTPRSFQMNVGIQREIRHGMVFTADYLRNVETRTLLGIDVNHVGGVANFDAAAASAAIDTTNAAFGGAPGEAGIATAVANGAVFDDYAFNGLTADTDFGQACGQAIGVTCAFHGKNPNQAAATFLQPVGRSVYNALQMKLATNVANPVKGIKAVNWQMAYSLSRFSNTGGAALSGTPADNDQDFVLATADNDQPGRYFGPAILDRTHQFSFGGYADVPFGFRVGLIAHFYSPLSTAIVVPATGDLGDIFRTDFTGDGTTQDPVPGTHFGQFDRGTDAKGLAGLVNNYNSNVAGTATPAGQALIGSGLATLADLQLLGAVAPVVPAPPADQANFSWLRAMDLRLAWRHTFKERFTIEPSVGFYNIANFSNFNLPPTTMNGLLTGASTGSINGTSLSAGENEQFRVGNGTGVYGLGAARQIEFGLRLTF